MTTWTEEDTMNFIRLLTAYADSCYEAGISVEEAVRKFKADMDKKIDMVIEEQERERDERRKTAVIKARILAYARGADDIGEGDE